ncbi:Acetyltransferase (GNAT) family protein [Paenibacillus sp. UNC496MF]|uniref:hypothetical protein n=1 Tax=Paenibacillus sp. UNC496MF TaxID=1502753 RepID=UPI0008EFE364|nr:hypothetical protein [Paenibacillus sp. UNC496MF]SFI28028.1 Acetyltransferase (GNAT) family protein [Paenibacillus sp. UNC496MF]
MEDAIVKRQLELLRADRCAVHDVAASRTGDTVILYSPPDRLDIHARIVYASGIATKRHLNDPVMHVTPAGGTGNAWSLQYIRILGDKINRGYGSLMMKQLLALAERGNVARIEGRLQQAEHRDHAERLRHFYGKFGFAVDADMRLRWDNPRYRPAPSERPAAPKPGFRFWYAKRAEKKDLHPF